METIASAGRSLDAVAGAPAACFFSGAGAPALGASPNPTATEQLQRGTASGRVTTYQKKLFFGALPRNSAVEKIFVELFKRIENMQDSMNRPRGCLCIEEFCPFGKESKLLAEGVYSYGTLLAQKAQADEAARQASAAAAAAAYG